MARSDLERIQDQLKVAVQDHQVLVSKMANDPQNANLQVQLHEIQSEIRNLSGKQKSVVEQLKKDFLERQAGSNEPTVELLDELLPTQTSPADLSYKHVPKSLDKSLDELPLPSAEDERSDVELPKPGNAAEPVETAAPLIRVPDFGVSRAAEVAEAADVQTTSDDQQQEGGSRPSQVIAAFKKPLDTAPGVNGKTVSEKKELSPEDRSKLEYMASLNLVTVGSLRELQTRRSERKRKNTTNPQFWYGNLEAETDIREDCCNVCHRSGELLMCDVCSLVYHLQCLDPPLTSVPVGLWSCPKCQTLSRQYGGKDDWPGTLALVHSYLMHKAAKEEEKKQMQKLNEELTAERSCLEEKARQLREVLTQTLRKKSELAKECGTVCQSLENLRNFIRLFVGHNSNSTA